jgi:hypothetical protein
MDFSAVLVLNFETVITDTLAGGLAVGVSLDFRLFEKIMAAPHSKNAIKTATYLFFIDKLSISNLYNIL